MVDDARATVLHVAAADGNLAVVKWLVSNGASCDMLDRRKRLAKDVAKRRDHLNVHSYLKTISKSKSDFVSVDARLINIVLLL